MTAVEAFVYIVARSLNDKDTDLKKFWVLVLKLVGFIMLALLISLPIVVSVVYSIMNAPKSAGYSDSLIPTLRDLVHFIPGFTDFAEIGMSYLYIGINALFTVFMPIIAISAFKKKKTPAVMCLFNIIMIIVPAWGIMLNGFSYKTGRWCYTLAFFCVYALVDDLDVLFRMTAKQKKICTVWALSQAALIVMLKSVCSVFTLGLTVVSFWNLVCMMLFISDVINTKKAVAGLLAANIGIGYFAAYSPFAGAKVGVYTRNGECYDCYSHSLLRAYSKIEENDDGFFRVDHNEHYNVSHALNNFINTPANETLYWRARGVYGYFSTIDQGFTDYNDSLMNSACNYRRTVSYSMDNRSRLNFLSGIKYYLTKEGTGSFEDQRRYAGYGYETIEPVKGVDIQRCELDPGLGYVFERSISRSEYDKLSAVEREECLMKNVVIDDADGISLSAPVLENDVIEPEFSIAEDSYVKSVNGEFEIMSKGQKLMLELDPEDYENCELYIMICGLQRAPFDAADRKRHLEEQGKTDNRYDEVIYNTNQLFTSETNNFECFASSNGIRKRILDTSNEPQGRSDLHDYMVNLGYAEKGSGKITVSFESTGKYTIEDVKLYALPVSSFEEDAKALSEKKFNVTSYDSDHIKGTCSAESDGMLYLSIPYHMGWTAVVDGAEVETKKVDICYLGVPISEGEHTVELKYRPIYFKESIILMFVGLIGTAAVCIGTNVLKKKKSAADKSDKSPDAE